jgi:membrane fusion protein (multidrug efflux system)
MTVNLLRHTASSQAIAVLAAASLAATLLGGCGDANGKTESDKSREAAPAVPVEISTPKVGEMLAVYSGTAAITADREAIIMPKVVGEIREVLVDEGDHVRAGQVLARLDGDQLRLEAAQAEANFRKLERDYERYVELQKRGLVSVTAFDNLKYELDSARAIYELTALQLSYTSIRSPIDGVVTDHGAQLAVGNTVAPMGSVVSAGASALFVVTDMTSLELSINVPEGQLSKIAVGQPAQITVDAVPGKVFEGHVKLIVPRVDSATSTFPVEIEIQDEEGLLRTGMFARIAVVYERRPDAVQIPRSALLDSDGPPTVFVVEGAKAVERPLELGLSNGGFVEVLSGLGRDEKVVVVGQGALKAGTEVRVVNEPATPTAG